MLSALIKSNIRHRALASFILLLILYLFPTLWKKQRANTPWLPAATAVVPMQINTIHSSSAAPLLSMGFPPKHWQTWKILITDEAANSTGISQEALTSWRELNPDFRYEFLTDASAETYMKYTFAHRANIVDIFFSRCLIRLYEPTFSAT